MVMSAGTRTPPDDPCFPALHVRPPRGWVNDPNGMSYVDGVFHAFFQHNPSTARHDRIHWGHATSTDLVCWTDEPVALTPRDGHADSFGCWSGSVVLDHGIPTAVYTGVVRDGGESAVLLARSDRTMRDWHQDAEPVTGMPHDERVVAMRDPSVLEVGGHRWAVQGAGLADGRAAVVVHACDDLRQWDYRGLLVSSDHPVAAERAPATVWECPQLVRVDGTWVLLVSPVVGAGPTAVLDRVAWLAGELRVEGGGLRFEPADGGRLDVGAAFYAPQALVLPDRVLLWGWVWEDGRDQADIDAAGWAGALSFPRELRFVDGVLASVPAAELVLLRRTTVHDADVPAGGIPVRSRAFEVAVPPASRTAGRVLRLSLRTVAGSQRVVAEVDLPAGRSVRAFVDASIVEVFVEGEPVCTSRAYPAAGETWHADIVAPSGAAASTERLTVWTLGLPPSEPSV